MSPFDDPAISGIAGTSVTLSFSFEMLRWLDRRCGRSVRIAWEALENADRLGETLPRFLPLLEEEALADANVPYASWIDAARGRSSPVGWLLRKFESLRARRAEAAELFDSLDLPVEWHLGRLPLSRTALRLPAPKLFCHGGRLVANRDVRIPSAMEGPRLSVARLSGAGAERALDGARAALATRYRELHGFTHGDPRTAIRAEREPGNRDLPLRPCPGPSPPDSRGLRASRDAQRRSDRLRGRARAVRARGPEFQHLSRVPRWRIGVRLRDALEVVQPAARRGHVFDRAVPDRRRERRGDRVGRVLVLPAARLSPGFEGAGATRAAGRGANRGGQVPPNIPGGAPPPRGLQHASRNSRPSTRGLELLPHPQPRPRGQPEGGDGVAWRRRPGFGSGARA